jgi:NADH:ubiquinone oxidoreductase subunit F (NADH-binding)
MNFDQIYAKAESESNYLMNSDCIQVSVSCRADHPAGSGIVDAFQAGIDKQGLNARVIRTGSFGYYEIEPLVLIEKPGHPGVLYKSADTEIVSELINDYLVNDNPRADLALCSFGNDKPENIPLADDLSLFNLQKRIALRNCGLIDPENINHYIMCGGYGGFSRALQMSRANVIEEIENSGLRGRGGAGYSTAEKWKVCSETAGEDKYVICNAVDSDPGSFTGGLLLTGDPHSFLEGLLISAYAVGASDCIVFMDSGYAPALEILNKAIEQMREYSLLGSNILDSEFCCEITIREAPVSFVLGEETAVIRLLEQKQVMPYLRPPYPAIKGLNEKPTLINNIETLSNVSAIFLENSEWFSGIGTGTSKGTKIVSLCDAGSNKYTVEVPFGTSLGSVVEIAGIGEEGRRNIKAVQFGGPTGAYFTTGELDIAIDYESIKESGSVIGSGLIELIAGNTCAVESAKEKISYLHEQSCGKCVFCREGSLQMSDILQDIFMGQGKQQDIEMLCELGEQMKTNCICALGRTAPNPVLSTIRLFRNEYEAHIKDKRCIVKSDT